MSNFLMMLAASGLFYAALSSTLYDMTVTDCNAGIELACKEVTNENRMFYSSRMVQNS